MAQIVVLLLNSEKVSTEKMKDETGMGSKQLSVTVQRLLKRGLIKRVEKGVYTLKAKRAA